MFETNTEISIRPPKDFQSISDEALGYSLVDCFEKVVQEHRENIAVSCESGNLSYDFLNKKCNQLAHLLLSMIGPNQQLVALILGHDIHAIQAIWGVLKSANAYVVTLPSLPVDRITQILEDMDTRIIVTDDHYLPVAKAAAANKSQIEIVNLDQLETELSCLNPGIPIPCNHMAYLIYTSGSTGAPKGVIHLHQNVLNTTIGQVNELCISPSDHLALYLTLAFDAARFCLYTAPLSGATLCLYDIRRNGIDALPAWIERERISVWHSTPSTFRHILSQMSKKHRFSHVRLINLGGEPASGYDVQLFKQHFSRDCILCNSLGTTETQTAARYLIDHRSSLSSNIVPVGFPLKGKTIDLVDESGQVVKNGETGEILVKSRYLSAGYWRQPDHTAEKFTSDPGDHELRIFHTGDLGRLRPDGCLEHLGRKDSQVKIRGMRIELAEIESVLMQQKGVRRAVVIARDALHDDKLLIAYVEPGENTGISKEKLRSALANRLPDYMLPAVIVFHDSLPITASGKVDTQALPPWDEISQLQEKPSVPARDAFEEQLVKIWENILKKRPIGMQDNFFELGGTSLMAAQLFGQVEKAFRKKLPLATLFQAPTIEQQAAILRQEDWVPDWSSLVVLQSMGKKPPIYFAAPVGGNVLSYHDLVVRLPPDQPCFGLQAVGLDGVQLPLHDIQEIASHYIQEIQTVQPAGPYYLAGSSFGGLVVYEMAQQLHDLDQSVALVVMFDTHGPNYPRRMPGMSRLRKRIYRNYRRLENHLNNLQIADWRGKWEYLRKKGWKLTNRLFRRVEKQIDQIRQPMSKELKKVRTAGRSAGKKQERKAREARRFDGRLVLFRASKQPLGIYPDPTLGWSALVGDDLEVYEIPGHHTSLIYEPRVNFLVEVLTRILEEVQSSEC